MPITWKNVDGPNFEGVSETLGRAGESLTEGVDAIRQGKDTFEKGRTDRNTQAFMDQLSQFGSPEELAAAQESGQVANMRSEFGNLINRDKTDSDAITDRVTGLRQQATADYNYDQTQVDRADKPLVDNFSNRLASISSDQGINGIGDSYDGFQSDVQSSMESGELSTSAGTQLLQQGQQRVNALEQNFDADQTRNRSQREQQWQDATRGAVTQYGQQVTKGSPVKPVEQAMVEDLRSKGVPEEFITNARTQFNSAANSGVVFGARDQAELDKQRSNVEREFNFDTNVYAKEGDFVPEEATNTLLAETMQTDEEGRQFFFQYGDTEARTELTEEVTGAMSKGVQMSVNGTTRTVPVAKAHVRSALRNIQGGDWEVNSTFQEEIKSVLKQSDAYNKSTEYTEGKRALADFDANQLKYLTGGRNAKNTQNGQREEQRENGTNNAKVPELLKRSSVDDSTGAEFGRDVVDSFKKTLSRLGDDFNNENGLGISASLNPNVNGSAANIVKQGVGMWRDVSNDVGNSITSAFTPNIASSPQTAAVDRVQTALKAGETPATSDLDQAMKLATDRPELFTKEAINLLIKAAQ